MEEDKSKQQKSMAAAPFLSKTYEIVDDRSTDHIVSWGKRESTFVVWRPTDLARQLLPNYFKHNNFSSFVRQLNTYGFKKIVPDRWEFENKNFKRGEKHLLCHIQRRKTNFHYHPHIHNQTTTTTTEQLSFNNHHHIHNQTTATSGHLSFNNHHSHHLSAVAYHNFPFPTTTNCQVFTLSPPPNSSDDSRYSSPSPSPPLMSLTAALAEENEQLRQSNALLMEEVAYMRNLYNDIIFFLHHHVKPTTSTTIATATDDDHSTATVATDATKTRVFGVSLSSKKQRLQGDYDHNYGSDLVLENNHDHHLGLNLNLMLSSPSS